MKRKAVLVLMLAVIPAVSAFAVFNERNFAKTLSILRSELHQENERMEHLRNTLALGNDSLHEKLVEMTEKFNELSLILYSQNQDYTFDMTYALEEVTKQYEDYKRQKMPFDDILERLELEIERYGHLADALRNLPPLSAGAEPLPDSTNTAADSTGTFFLDRQGCEDRDSCLAYVLNLLNLYTEFRDRTMTDNERYYSMSSRLEESYNYARSRYQLIQKHIFADGQDNYLKVLGSLPRYTRQALQDTRRKYGIGDDSADAVALSKSDWRGPVISGFVLFILLYIAFATLAGNLAVYLLKKKSIRFRSESFKARSRLATSFSGFIIFAATVMLARLFVDQNFFRVASKLLLVYAWLMAAILLSLMIRIPAPIIRRVSKLYLPVSLLGLLVIIFRIIFIPNKLVNLLFPPVILAFTIWQLILCRRLRHNKEARGDMMYGWLSFGVMLTALVMSCCGYVLLSVQIFIWWLFQLTAIETITAIYVLLRLYEKKRISELRLRYDKEHSIYGKDLKDSHIAVTWLFDFIKLSCLPVLMIVSVPLCLWLASGIFDLTEICKDLFYRPFFNLIDKNGSEILHLSLYKLVLVSALFFLFRYIAYLAKALYRKAKYDKLSSREGKTHIHTNEINLTLANNIIGILVWGSYIIIAIVLLKIPMGALSLVAAGLATGLGLAMKDILNNFIYSIQLMSGRLRAGDYIECDGIRGKVTSISYQTTQIQTVEDTLIAFTNTTLFNKNFKNLTRGSAYEYIKISVGVSYGTDIDKLRPILLEASKELMTRDKYNRDVVDPKRGITVSLDNFGESSVEIAMKQYVLVEERYAYTARAKEMIYKTLNENGFSIPFPQHDIYIKSIVQS